MRSSWVSIESSWYELSIEVIKTVLTLIAYEIIKEMCGVAKHFSAIFDILYLGG